MELRDYQREAVESILGDWGAFDRTLLVLPTGCGKTVCFCEVARRRPGRVLMLAHREELIEQAAAKAAAICCEPVGIEKAGRRAGGERIVCGSVQTLMGDSRIGAVGGFQTIIVDEAHHALSDSYQRVLGAATGAKVLGVTATPDRADRRNLGSYFEKISFEYSMLDAVKAGYLCRIAAKQIPLEIDLTKVKVSHGDYLLGNLGSAIEPYLGEIANVMAYECAGRKTVVFLPLVDMSKRFAAMLCERGMSAAEVNGNSPDRAEVIADFESGRYDVLCNSMLLTEGWDCPPVDCIVVLRPTKSRALYAQMVGRGTRPHPGKDSLLLLDFLWLTQDHRLIKPAHLVAADDKVREKMDAAEGSGGQMDLLDAMEQAERDVVAEREDALAKRLAEQRKKKARLVDPLQFAVSILSADLADWSPTFAWEHEPPSEGQIKALEKAGLATDEVGCKGFASQLLDRLSARRRMGLATPKQIRCLEQRGFVHVGMWSFDEASSMIARMAMNRWRIPSGIDPKAYVPESGGGHG